MVNYKAEKRRIIRQKFKRFFRKLFNRSQNAIVIENRVSTLLTDPVEYETSFLRLLQVTGTDDMTFKFELVFRAHLTPDACELFGDLDRVQFQNAISPQLLAIKRLFVYFEDEDQLIRFRLVAGDQFEFRIL